MMAPGAPINDTHGVELPPRYEIRLITPDLSDWISALTYFNHHFESAMWSAIDEGHLASMALKAYHLGKFLYEMPEMATRNGLSYCIWDKEFVLDRDNSSLPTIAGVQFSQGIQ